MSQNQFLPMINQNITNNCNCRKPGCKLCCGLVNPCSDPYYLRYYNNSSACKSGCKKKCKNTCVPYLPKKDCKKKIVTWRVKYLVSNDQSTAAHFDSALANPVGIVVANNQIWVANNFSDVLLSYDLHGNRLYAPVVMKNVPNLSGSPSGLVMNCSGSFTITSDTQSSPSFLLAVTEHGTVVGYSPTVNQVRSFVVVNTQVSGDIVVYKGCAIVDTFLYCADFYNNKIDVYNGQYELQTGFPFIDGDITDPIPPEFATHNIVHIGCYLYVAYSKQIPNLPVSVLHGPGLGYISIFNVDGTFVRRFHSRGVLNDPWAIIPAPCECGFPKDGILIGNFGDGTINSFDCTGEFCGKLLSVSGNPLVIDGLWGLATYYKCNNEIFFSASPDLHIGNKGLIGSIMVDQVLDI